MEEDQDYEMFREIMRSLCGNLSEEEFDRMVENGELEVKIMNFDAETQSKMDKIAVDDEAGQEALMQQINYLTHHGEHRKVAEENGIQIFEVGEKKFSNEDTSDVEPISEDDFNDLMGS